MTETTAHGLFTRSIHAGGRIRWGTPLLTYLGGHPAPDLSARSVLKLVARESSGAATCVVAGSRVDVAQSASDDASRLRRPLAAPGGLFVGRGLEID